MNKLAAYTAQMKNDLCTVLCVVHSLHRYKKMAALIDTKQEAISYRSICHVDKIAVATSRARLGVRSLRPSFAALS